MRIVKYLYSFLCLFVIGINMKGQSIDTVYFENFNTSNVPQITLSDTNQLQVFSISKGFYTAINLSKYDTARIEFNIPELKLDSFALVVNLANLNNEKRTWYRIDDLRNGNVIVNVNWWKVNPSYFLALTNASGDSSYNVELQSADTSAIEPKRRLYYKATTNTTDGQKRPYTWRETTNKRIDAGTGYNTFSFVKLGENIHFFDKGYRHYFKVDYPSVPKDKLCSFNVVSDVSRFIVLINPGAKLSINYVLLTKPESLKSID